VQVKQFANGFDTAQLIHVLFIESAIFEYSPPGQALMH